MLKNLRLFLPLVIASLAITACGQKGPLYKTPEKQDNQSQQSVDQPEGDKQQGSEAKK